MYSAYYAYYSLKYVNFYDSASVTKRYLRISKWIYYLVRV